MSTAEFEEIGHSGGRVTFTVVTAENGVRSFQVSFQSSRPVPMALFAVYALPQGVAVAPIRMGGIGQPWNPPPVPGCFPVFIASDSQGKFGYQCPQCRGYWRADGGSSICPYCGVAAQGHDFLTDAQRSYVFQYCARLRDALDQEKDGDHVIDMDAVADAAGKEIEKPPFYYVEESQQTKFTCEKCGCFNDILGNFGYCSRCGTRNDLRHLETDTIAKIRDRINAGGPYEACLRDTASAFDSFVAQYVKQLIQHVPMRSGRRNRLEKMRFHDLKSVTEEISSGFDIDIFEGLKENETALATLMFHRRHVYDHNGGEVDDNYLKKSGDTSVRLKQALRETQKSTHDFANTVVKMATNLHHGFHDILEPEAQPIAWHNKMKRHINEG